MSVFSCTKKTKNNVRMRRRTKRKRGRLKEWVLYIRGSVRSQFFFIQWNQTEWEWKTKKERKKKNASYNRNWVSMFCRWPWNLFEFIEPMIICRFCISIQNKYSHIWLFFFVLLLYKNEFFRLQISSSLFAIRYSVVYDCCVSNSLRFFISFHIHFTMQWH